MTRATSRAAKATPTSDDAAIYTRISDDRESEENGVTRQEEDGQGLAGKAGLRVRRVYRDNDIGASTRSRKDRPGYDAMLKDARAGRIGVIIAYSSSRLTRRPLELEGQIQLAEQYGVRFMYAKSPSFDLNTADGRQIARMLAAADAAEAERTGERVSRAALQRAERGENHGGRRGYGFTASGAVVASEAAQIRSAASALLSGVSLRQIAADLNTGGVPTVTGGRWSGATVRDVLLKPRVAGLTVHDGVEVGKLPGESILPEETWRTLVDMLTDESRRSQRGRPPKWLGSGLYHCVCGAVMDVGPRDAYRCRSLRSGPGGGGHVRRSAPALDEFVTRLVVERLSRPDAADLFARPASPEVDLPALRREAARLRGIKTKLAERYGAGDLDDAEFAIAKRANADRLREVEIQLTEAVETSPLAPLVGADDVRAAWESITLGQRRAVVAMLLTVTVLPVTRAGAGFDEDAVRIEWC